MSGPEENQDITKEMITGGVDPAADIIDRASDDAPIGQDAPAMLTAPEMEPIKEGYIDSRFKIHHEDSIPELSTEFAKACKVSGRKAVDEIKLGEIYGLIFHPKYPAPITLIRRIRQIESPLLPRIVDEGKVEIAGVARYMVILEKPPGVRFSEYLQQKGQLPEQMLSDQVVPALNEGLKLLHDEGYIHGSINADTIYFDEATRQTSFGEFFSSYAGFNQKVSYETINRLLCHPIGKGGLDAGADYYAMGILLVHLLTGREPLGSFSQQEVLDHRLLNGSYDISVFEIIQRKVKLTGRMQQLLRALIKDVDSERWEGQKVTEWVTKKVSTAVHSSKSSKETTNPFIFLNEKYYSRKHLAHAVFMNWSQAKTNLKPSELVRWLRLSLKQSPLAEKMENIFAAHLAASANLVIPDERLARMIILLDPSGPVRYKGYSAHIYGIGPMLSYAFYKGEREMVQFIGDMLNDRLLEFWVEVQEEAGGYDSGALPWSPHKEHQYVRKGALGFGIERCLYDLNPTLSCQSPLVVDDYVLDVGVLMTVLNEKAATKRPDADPMDRHIAAFIANRIDLLDEIRVKSLQRFPMLNKNAQVSMLALLTVAQAHGRIKALKGLSSWVSIRLSTFIDEFHSEAIKREIRTSLDRSAREGNLNAMFRAISDAAVPTRDNNGYLEARAQYKLLEMEVRNLESGGVVERLGYQYGLKIAVMVSYIVLAATILLALARFS